MYEHVPAKLIREDKKRYRNLIRILKNYGYNILDKNSRIVEIGHKCGNDLPKTMGIDISFGEEFIEDGEEYYNIDNEVYVLAEMSTRCYNNIQEELAFRMEDLITYGGARSAKKGHSRNGNKK